MTNSLQFEPRAHLHKTPVLSKWAIIQLSMSLLRLWSLFLRVEDFTPQKKKHLGEAIGLYAACRYAQNEDKTNTKEAVTPHVPPVPNPSTPESVPTTPSSELRSKCERMAHRSAPRESWPPQSLLCPWTKVLLRARHIHWKPILRCVPKLSFTLDQWSCFVDIPWGSHHI